MKKEKNNDKKNTRVVKDSQDKLFIVLVVILVILSVVILVIKIVTRNNLDTESELVTELHNYFNSENLGDCEGLFNYSEDKITYEKIDAETRLCIAYQKAQIKDVETGTIEATKKKETCTKDGMTFRINEDTKECTYSKIERSVIDNSYKKLYGEDIENNDSFKVDNLNICYLKDDYYYCGLSETFTYTLGNESIIYRVMEKAVEKGSSIIIEDYFVKLNTDTCFKNYTTTTINSECTKEYKAKKDIDYKFMKEFGTKYKHTYNKADDGTYYWVSSEPIEN